MKYLIVFSDGTEPFFTKWFQKENHFVDGMIVFDLESNWYTTDGENWVDIPEDHL